MFKQWDKEIRADRIYLPAHENSEDETKGVPIDREMINYINREFPMPVKDKNQCSCYSIPTSFVQHGEKQGCQAELESYNRLSAVKLPTNVKETLWQAAFQGICYAGRSYRNARDGRLMTREHDLVLFNKYDDKYFISLIEVKSTCDDPSRGFIVSDANSIKNNKRSGQHQIRDHLEIIQNVTQIPVSDINTFLFWPYLTRWTTDPRGNRVMRWENEKNLHVFTDTFSEQEAFNEWLYKNVLCGKSIDKEHFNKVFQRFIILSCGIFVNEIHDGMLALLTQQQVSLLHKKPKNDGAPTVIHGAAGTGKTLLILHRLSYLHECGLLNKDNRALYICYWQGIRTEFCQKLEKLNISEYVDTVIFLITRDGFLKYKKNKYRHIFMDECEAIYLAFNKEIISNTFKHINRCRLNDYDEDFHYRQIYYNKDTNDSTPYEYGYQIENNEIKRSVKPPDLVYGDLWYLVDTNQVTIFIPKYSPDIVKNPDIILSRIVRNTRTIYNVFSQFYNNPTMLMSDTARNTAITDESINVGHNIIGPPIYWIDSENFPTESLCPDVLGSKTFNALIAGIIDLYATKGIIPHDLCVLPFLISELYLPENINKAIASYFVPNGFQPTSTTSVEEFIVTKDQNKFLVPWVLRVKGLEFKVVIIVIEEDDGFDQMEVEDRRKVYIMASRCTCLLILISTKSVKDAIDVYKVIKAYPFNEEIIM